MEKLCYVNLAAERRSRTHKEEVTLKSLMGFCLAKLEFEVMHLPPSAIFNSASPVSGAESPSLAGV
jgi:hypothetical protein